MNLSTVSIQSKYGLVKSKNKTAPLKRTIQGFGEEDEEEQPTVQSNRKVQRYTSEISKDALKLQDDAKKENANIFDYDGIYDEMKSSVVDSHPLSRSIVQEAPKSRYIENLKATAKVREKEKDRIFENRLLKERKLEDEQFSDAPKFITSAYREKLMEAKKWEYEDRLAEEVERRTDVRTQGMQGFYSNLFTKNVSVGGDLKNATSAYTAGSARQQKVLREGEGEGEVVGGKENSEGDPEKEEEREGEGEGDRRTQEHEEPKRTDHIKRIEQLQEGESPQTSASGREPPRESVMPPHIPSTPVEHEENTASSISTNKSTVESARERYLARKQQKEQGK